MRTWMITRLVMVISATALGCGGGAAAEGSGGAGGGSSGTTTTSSTNGTGGTGGTMSPESSITVSTTDQHQAPVPNVPIVVIDAAGVVVLVTQSGPDGTVPVAVPLGGSVAAFASYNLYFDVQAVVDPPDQGTVRFTIRTAEPASPAPPEKTTFHVTLAQIPQGTQELDVYSCWKYERTFPPKYDLTIDNESCTQQDTSTFLAVALGAQSNVLAWGIALEQANNPGGGADVQIALAHTDIDQFSGAISDIPGAATGAQVDISADVDSMSPSYFRAYGVENAPDSTYGAQLLFPSGVFKSFKVTDYVTINGGTGSGSSSDVTRQRVYAKLPNTASFDVASIALVSMNPLDVSEPLHPQATWSVGAGPRGDYGTVYMQWGGGTAWTTYRATFPPDHATSFRVPDIPPELSSFAPTKTSTFGYTTVEYTDDERTNGYAESAIFHDVPLMDGLGSVVSSGEHDASP